MDVPKNSIIELPPWIWGGRFTGLLDTARLRHNRRGPSGADGRYSVSAVERYFGHSTAGLVNCFPVLTADHGDRTDRLVEADATASNIVSDDVLDLEDLESRFFHDGEDGGSGRFAIARRMALIQLRTAGSSRPNLAATVRGARQALVDVHLSSEQSAFPNAAVYAVHRTAALAMRYKLPAICLRIQNDPELRDRGPGSRPLGDVDDDHYTPFFGSSHALADGVYIFECYIAPLMGSLSPFVWAFPAARGEVTAIYTLGRAMGGADGLPAEPLQAIAFRGARQSVETPNFSTAASGEAVAWWFKKMDNLFAAVSDPAVHTGQTGEYRPGKHLNALLSLEQLFRRVAVVQRSVKDIDARRLALFSVLDTLHRLTGREITVLCRIGTAEKVLASLETAMPAAAQEILLPACRRAVQALRDVQTGFFLANQTGSDVVTFADERGMQTNLTLSEAAAQYVKMLRNATHGFGDISHRRRTEALLVQHSGHVPDDLAFLAWLYLLDLMTNPDRLRKSLWARGAE